MEPKEILAQVKIFFTELMTPAAPAAPAPPVTDAPKEYDLKDGGKVTIDKLEVGGIVMIDGATAIPGDLELADGTKLTVGDNGAITALTPAEPAAPAPEDMNTKFTAFENATNQKFADYETKFAAQELQLQEMKVSLNKASKVIGKLLELSELIVDQPAAPADPATRPASSFIETFANNL